MNNCGVTHQCGGGKTAACTLLQGHLSRHFCRECLTYFNVEDVHHPGLPAKPATGTHPAIKGFLQMQQAARSSKGLRAPARDGQPDIFGIWKGAIPSELGPMQVELILQPTKQFSQTIVLGCYMTYDVGTFTMEEGFLHFSVDDHEPKKYNGVDMNWVKSFSLFYKIEDANTVTFEDGLSHDRWPAQRE